MRCPGQKPALLGCIAIGLGVFILLTLILPPGFWRFALGVGLIVFGAAACFRCR